MLRYKLTLEYDGSRLCGWQRQLGVDTVQGVLEGGLYSIFQRSFLVEGAGRTDRGVHALGQVAHVDIPSSFPSDRLLNALNFYVRDKGVVVVKVEVVDSSFHARFSAKQRRYRYVILNRKAPSALGLQRVWHVPVSLCVEAMQEAAGFFVGFHNFNSFRASSCQAENPFRTIDFFSVTTEKEHIFIDVHSRSFLHNQVRIMVGSLKMIGEKKQDPAWIQSLLSLGDRRVSGPTAPPFGLFLVDVIY